MNKKTKIIIALLIVSNLILIGFLYFGKPKNNHSKPPMKMIIERLDFDEPQKAEFAKLIEVHRNDIENTHKRITKAKNNIYKDLKSETPSLNDSLIQVIATEVKQIEGLHFNHFKDIKNICNDKQKEEFNKLADELGTVFQPNKRPKNKRHDK